MRWLQQMLGRNQVQHDPGRQEALLQDARHRFGARVQAPIPEQVDALVRMLDGDDGLSVAARILHEFAEQAHADFLAQAYELHRRTGRRLIVDRTNYRPLWRKAAPALRWPLFELPGGLHPYVQVVGAVTVVGSGASRFVQTTDPKPVLAHLFEVLDLTIVGWEYGRVRVDTHAATLAYRLIMSARDVRAAMDDPPPLPPPVRELMRRNNTVDVLDPAGSRVVGGFNPGAEMRAALLA
ncbi:hypothetical protein [Micromonospora inyonensis]|uniref:Uncharacterized protein n=1 Tax=Micromonospora inyonensis TaxID=47866 RepID=A0A1C6SNP0_9ACTN|nr:hypothetical protein [Micromonospora inyonensis]SCL31110.1 hypothetical protein GA0074694_5886 [Micromonospora inyonensis]